MSAPHSEIVTRVKNARRVSVPLVAITTPDPAATVRAIREALKADVPIVAWDVVEGMQARNEAGKAAVAKITGGEFDGTVGNPLEALRVAARLPACSVLFLHLANRWLGEASVVQAAWNLRDAFKGDRRMLVLLGPAIDLPPELAGDVVVFDEPLPDSVALEAIINEQLASADLESADGQVAKSVEAVQGLPAFQAEQTVALSLSKSGIDVPALWELKRRQIELTPGLKVSRDQVRFKDVGGVAVVKQFLGRVLTGEARPNAIVFIDEIEKFLAGATGGAADSSGVSQDQLGTLLSYMQDHAAVGSIFVGPPGSAKSMVAKAMGNEAGIPTIQLDPGGMKGSLVGQSEQQLRAALKVITSVSNGRSLWVATCNAISDLPPELRRRFTLGTFFFDLPSAEERKAIWQLWLSRFGLKAPKPPLNDDGWTGAEIRQCCDIAWRLSCSLTEAAEFVVPVSRSAGDQIERLRKAAEGKFLSASHSGVYSREPVTNNTAHRGRRAAVELED